MPFTQDRFLSNTENKTNFINFVTTFDTIRVLPICPGDADSIIVKTTLDMANTSWGHVTVVTDDTDIAVMLVHHWQSNNVYLFQERWNKAWSIRDASSKVKTSNNTCSLSTHGLVVKLFRLCLGNGKQSWPKTSQTKNGNNYQK